MREKREGTMLLSFSTLVLQSSTMIFMIESLIFCNFLILVGIFILELGLYIPMIGFLTCLRSLWASKLDAHPLSFFLSFHTLIALVHPLHGNPYSFTLISISGHLHSPLICLVDVNFLPPFCPLPPSIPPIVLYPWLTLIYCVKSEKVWECISMNTIAWLTPGWAWFILCAKKREHNKIIWFCRDSFLLPCYFWCFMILSMYAWSIIVLDVK
jgi:hypothetical protein